MNTFLYIFHRIIRKASGEIKAMTGNMGRGEGVETKGRTFTSRAERWEGGREGERKRKKERVGCTKYQRTILQSKQDGGCHTAYPRLNATSYFESSSNASLSLPSPGVTPRSFSSKLERVPPDRMHRCHRYPPSSSLLLLDRREKSNSAPQTGGDGCPFATILLRILRANGQFA